MFRQLRISRSHSSIPPSTARPDKPRSSQFQKQHSSKLATTNTSTGQQQLGNQRNTCIFLKTSPPPPPPRVCEVTKAENGPQDTFGKTCTRGNSFNVCKQKLALSLGVVSRSQLPCSNPFRFIALQEPAKLTHPQCCAYVSCDIPYLCISRRIVTQFVWCRWGVRVTHVILVWRDSLVRHGRRRWGGQ